MRAFGASTFFVVQGRIPAGLPVWDLEIGNEREISLDCLFCDDMSVKIGNPA